MAKRKSNTALSDEDKTVWNSANIEQALLAVENGFDLPVNPFYEKDINYRKPDLYYEYSDFELSEIQKCADSVLYFANNYAYTMTDGGMTQIKLRDYQEEVLDIYQNNKEVVFMASRQIGKCVTGDTMINVRHKQTKEVKQIQIQQLYFEKKPKLSIVDKIICFLYSFIK